MPDTVLIVDDQPVNLLMLSELLRGEHAIVTAQSGSEALDLLAGTLLPDLILLDVMMPEPDGFEVCRRIKADPRLGDIPVVFVTVAEDEIDEARGLALGAVDYITKPIAPAIVKARVRNHLALRRSSRALMQANAELRRLASTDPLTGAANRRRFFERAEDDVVRAKRRSAPVSLLTLDIDRFKAVNDGFGHANGDTALKRLVEIAEDTVRASDMVARLGGEEFVVLLPEAPLVRACEVGERLRANVEAAVIETDQGPLTMTVSIGAAEMQPGEPVERALARADAALYRAKREGRNRLIAAE